MISDALRIQILTHAADMSPNECCGVVATHKGKNKYFRCMNISDDPINNFILSPHDFANVEDIADIQAIVHSHPRTNANPTQADLVGIEATKLPWIIVNPLTKQITLTSPSNYEAPLVGRKFHHGLLDCYTLIRDYYSRKLGINIPDFDRKENWWEKGDDLYRENFNKAGFHKVDEPQEHDVIIMTASSKVPNHAGIYLGENKILHHVQCRLSSRDSYGGYWQKNTWGVVRHESFL